MSSARRLTGTVLVLALALGLAIVGAVPASAAVSHPLITTKSLPDATVGKAYDVRLRRDGGVRPFTWRIDRGRLPSGLTLSRRGRITGVPTAEGSYTIVLRVTDSHEPSRHRSTAQLTLDVTAMTVTRSSLPVGVVGADYVARLRTNAGKDAATWEVVSGSLPDGLHLTTGGRVTGSPNETGIFAFVAEASTPTTPVVTVREAFSVTAVTPDHVGPVVVEHCGDLAFDERWTSGQVHHLTCPVVVPSGVTLTVEPGTVVKADADAGITVGGRLAAPNAGTAAATFTSWLDDSAGGDTNGDGSATMPEAGGWAGISGAPTWPHPPATIDLQRVQVRYAGVSLDNHSATYGPSTPRPTLSVTGSTFENGSFVDLRNLGDLTVTGNTVTNGSPDEVAEATNGIHVIQDSESSSTMVSRNVVDGATSCGIYVGTPNPDPTWPSYARLASPVVRRNAVSSQREPVCVASGNLDAEDLTGNTTTNVHYRAIRLAGRTRTSLSTVIGDLPVTLGSDDAPGYTSGLTAKGLTVDKGGSLTAVAGSVVRAYDQVGISVNGTFAVDGAAGAPATFTHVHDDTLGDYEGDGGQTSAVAFGWTGISVYGSDALPVAVDVDRMVLRYAPLEVESLRSQTPVATVSVTNSTLQHGARLRVVNAGPITVSGNTVTNTTSAELFRTGNGIMVFQRRAESPTTVSGNTVTGATACAIDVTTSEATAASPVVTDNTGHSDKEPVCVTSNRLKAKNLTGNASTNPAYRGLLLSGRMTSDLTLPLGDLPVTIGRGGSAWGPPGLSMASDTTLTVEPGTIVKAYESTGSTAGLTVNGTLAVEGTEAAPATFTSVNDDTVGGDYTGDGSASTPNTWGAIRVVKQTTTPATLTVDHLAVRYGSLTASVWHADEATAPTTSITDSSFAHGSQLSMDVKGPVVVSGNTVQNTGSERARAINGIRVSQQGHASSTVVEDNAVDGAWECGVFVLTAGSVALSPVVRDNSSTSRREPLCVYSNELRGENLSGNSSANTAYRGFALGGRLVSDLDIPAGGLPLTLGNIGLGYSDDDWRALGLRVASGVALTIAPGSVVKSQPPADAGWVGGARLSVDGVLNADGTAENPVVFTSRYDAAHGGDYAPEFAWRSPQAGDWGGIVMGPTGQANLAEAWVLYGPSS